MELEINKKIRVLALCDTPTSATGFAQLSRNVLKGLVDTGKYEIDIIGINYFGDYYDREKFPFNIYPAMPQGYQDMYGRGRVIQGLAGKEAANGLRPPWDIVFTIQDSFIIEGLNLGFPFGEQLKVTKELWKRNLPPEQWFSWIGYFPVDSDLKENWVDKAILLPDVPVMYCEWGKQKALEYNKKEYYLNFNITKNIQGEGKEHARMKITPLSDKVKVIHHGVDLKQFFPISDKEKKEFRKHYFGGFVKDDTFLVVNVSRNQPRKDLSRTLQAFSLFKKKVPNALLYLHCKESDAGGSIHEMARNFKLSPGEDYMIPQEFSAQNGFPIETINKIYNVADLCITTTLGEGWGFMLTEAMATKTPVCAPYITSVIDIFGGEGMQGDWFDRMRGIPVKAGSTTSEWLCYGQTDNERVRPVTNVDDMVNKMVWVYNNPLTVKKITERAYAWVKDLSWENITKQWDAIFMETYNILQAERTIGREFDECGRNDPCPCDSGKKFKHCHALVNKFDEWTKGVK